MQRSVQAGFRSWLACLASDPRAVRTAILPIGLLPRLARECGHDITESDMDSGLGSWASIGRLGYVSNHEELLTYQMCPVAETEYTGVFRGFSLGILSFVRRMCLSGRLATHSRPYGLLLISGLFRVSWCSSSLHAS